jgi:hypothetical protein
MSPAGFAAAKVAQTPRPVPRRPAIHHALMRAEDRQLFSPPPDSGPAGLCQDGAGSGAGAGAGAFLGAALRLGAARLAAFFVVFLAEAFDVFFFLRAGAAFFLLGLALAFAFFAFLAIIVLPLLAAGGV